MSQTCHKFSRPYLDSILQAQYRSTLKCITHTTYLSLSECDFFTLNIWKIPYLTALSIYAFSWSIKLYLPIKVNVDKTIKLRVILIKYKCTKNLIDFNLFHLWFVIDNGTIHPWNLCEDILSFSEKIPRNSNVKLNRQTAFCCCGS